MKALTQWLLLLALLVSPLAMQPAAATVPQGHATMASTMPGHCDPAPASKAHLPGECAMACASALPATDLPSLAAPLREPAAVRQAQVALLSGRILQVATPPPRTA
jgi:hypothetical protein